MYIEVRRIEVFKIQINAAAPAAVPNKTPLLRKRSGNCLLVQASDHPHLTTDSIYIDFSLNKPDRLSFLGKKEPKNNRKRKIEKARKQKKIKNKKPTDTTPNSNWSRS